METPVTWRLFVTRPHRASSSRSVSLSKENLCVGPDRLFAAEPELSAEEFQALLGLRRLRTDGLQTISPASGRMLASSDLVITARDGTRLIGISRAITDFAYCCYLSDLAVDAAFQRRGIGKRLIEVTHRAAGPETTLVLISAPSAEAYYQKIGLTHMPRCWTLPRKR